jgi:hypothetical protein
MITLGSYARIKQTKILVQAISSPYTKNNQEFIDVRLVFDPMVTYIASIDDLEIVEELE